MPRMIHPWTKLDCSNCGVEFLFTRADARRSPGPSGALCIGCAGYADGASDAAAEIAALKDRVRRLQNEGTALLADIDGNTEPCRTNIEAFRAVLRDRV